MQRYIHRHIHTDAYIQKTYNITHTYAYHTYRQKDRNKQTIIRVTAGNHIERGPYKNTETWIHTYIFSD